MEIKEIVGNLIGNEQKHAIIVSRFNEFITESLLKGCLDGLQRHGVNAQNIVVCRVPGAYEIPVTADRLASSKRFDAIICLGAVIRGSTAHFDFVASESAKVGNISLKHSLPIIFGVLTTENIEQAIERAGTKAGNKGYEAATTAIEMVNLFKNI